MLTSLFGDLGMAKEPSPDEEFPDTLPPESAATFTASAVFESTDTSVNDRGQMVERHVKDLFITGSPAQAMRAHFASYADTRSARHAITLYDPVGAWAPATLKALSDASGQPIERLHLRDLHTLQTLAMIERTRIVRRHDDALKIYHVDERSPLPEHADIPVVLMERAQLSAVIVGPMHGSSINRMLAMLVTATHAPSWRCPQLMFMLPPAALWIAGRIESAHWPEWLQVTVLNEPLDGTSAVWNALLETWSHARQLPQREPGGGDGGEASAAMPQGDAVSQAERSPRRGSEREAERPAEGETEPAPRGAAGTAGDAASVPATTATASDAPPEPQASLHGHGLDLVLANALLHQLTGQAGVLAAALVDAQNGAVLASDVRATLEIDIAQFGTASAQSFRAQRLAAQSLGMTDLLDEIVLRAGSRKQVVRCLTRQRDVILVALLDAKSGPVASLRTQLLAIDRQLA